MPRLTDPVAIRTLLETDRWWSIYPLGDLAPHLFPSCEWFHLPGGPPALMLVCRVFATPVLFALGETAAVQLLLDEVREEPAFYLHVRPEVLALLEPRYRLRDLAHMWRMALDPEDYRPASAEHVVRLGAADVPALQRLYADGETAGESPHFFAPAMVEEGAFFGLWEGPELVAVAGTHLVVAAESVGAIGNIYTRRDRRGRGLAAATTSAVVNELLRLGLRTVALNVSQTNAAAVQVYERLGFVRYCDYYEGLAERR